MNWKRFLLALLSTLVVTQVTLAQSTTFVLYSVDRDVNGDGVAERVMVTSENTGDPTSESQKSLLILRRSGEKYVSVFKADLGSSGFTNQLESFQWEDAGTLMAGIEVRQGSRYPEIWIVFAPNTDHVATFQFDGKAYREIR